MKIPFFRYEHVFGQQRDEILSALLPILERGSFILQRNVLEFESQIAKFVGAKYAIGTGNATDALELIIKAAGIGPGDEVILPSHTFIASAAAIHNNGAIPILADIGSDHLVDPASVESLITPRTKAIMPVQLNGRVCDMDRLGAIAAKNGILLIEDSSQALGAKFKGCCAGTFGLAGVFSFYPAKVLGCFGDGGMVITNDDAIAEKIRLLRDHGRGGHGGVVEMWGHNSRLDNIHATIMLVKMKRYPQEISRRREIAAKYEKNLKQIKKIKLPPAPDSQKEHFDIFQNYEIQAYNRDVLKEFLANEGIGTIVQWGGKALHQFVNLGFQCHLPNTDKLFHKCLLLPMNTSLTDEEVDFICSKIQLFYS
jgi:dTDP-4-amino-4,6-dideoxygalactose transaminase